MRARDRERDKGDTISKIKWRYLLLLEKYEPQSTKDIRQIPQSHDTEIRKLLKVQIDRDREREGDWLAGEKSV